MVFHGPQVKWGQFAIYDLFAANGVTTILWDAQLDGIYSNYIDMQRDAMIAYDHSLKLSLADASKKILGMDLKIKFESQVEKEKTFLAYGNPHINEFQVQYAAMDSIICLKIRNYLVSHYDASLPFNQVRVGRVLWCTKDKTTKDYKWCVKGND